MAQIEHCQNSCEVSVGCRGGHRASRAFCQSQSGVERCDSFKALCYGRHGSEAVVVRAIQSNEEEHFYSTNATRRGSGGVRCLARTTLADTRCFVPNCLLGWLPHSCTLSFHPYEATCPKEMGLKVRLRRRQPLLESSRRSKRARSDERLILCLRESPRHKRAPKVHACVMKWK